MKKTILLFLLPMILVFGQTINFDDPLKWTQGSGPFNTYQNDHKYVDQINGYDVEFSGNLILRETAGDEDGYTKTHSNSDYSWRLKEGAETSFTATVHATQIDGFSFYIRQQNNTPEPVYVIERIPSSTDTTGGWLVIARLDSANFFGDNSDWKFFSFTWPMTAPDSIEGITIKISPWGFLGTVDGIMIDDFSFVNPLPVELTTFSASVNNNNIELNWETATEVNNYGFNIERKLETGDWNKVGFVNGHGNSNSPKNYSYVDNTVNNAGKYFYRLKQVDIDGSYEYSSTAEIDLTAQLDYKLNQNFPNPFNPTTNIQFSLPEVSQVKLVVFNTIGEQVAELVNENMEAGNHNVKFNASDLNSGIYIYQIEANGFVQVRKMILVK
ncbi:MAG: T9SS type A sorting domain-containing protein [Ignavibacteriae bacterium]|nr:T9SS type A sorting domain-containing protein [Ignavibacteriota bacterium]